MAVSPTTELLVYQVLEDVADCLEEQAGWRNGCAATHPTASDGPAVRLVAYPSRRFAV